MFPGILFALAGVSLLQVRSVQGRIEYEQRLYEGDYCDLKCGKRPHTLCNISYEMHCPGGYNVVFNIVSFESINIKQLLIVGHNGLRNRIAYRMNSSSMLEIAWAYELEVMANAFLRNCQPFRDDDCAHYNETVDPSNLFEYFIKLRKPYQHVAQNRFCVNAKSFPPNLIEMALRTWYYEKVNMTAPIYRQHERYLKFELGSLAGENNFTHLAHPLTVEFGCGIARFGSTFCVVCFYYPYFRSSNNTMSFLSGPPISDCPSYFPLTNEYFTGLCTGGHDVYFETILNGVLPLKASFLMYLLLFVFVCVVRIIL